MVNRLRVRQHHSSALDHVHRERPDEGGDGLDRRRKLPVPPRLGPREPVAPERDGHRRAFGTVLDADADRERDSGREAGGLEAGGNGTEAAGSDRVALKVALADDSVLTNVVTAVSSRGSHLVGLAKSEPSLEDVFVELVGRGFGDDDALAGAS